MQKLGWTAGQQLLLCRQAAAAGKQLLLCRQAAVSIWTCSSWINPLQPLKQCYTFGQCRLSLSGVVVGPAAVA
jgi:hypothetical protein